MKCNCFSYNQNVGMIPEVILEAPVWSKHKEVYVDNCIADVIRLLWESGYITNQCCCGHNYKNPYIIFDNICIDTLYVIRDLIKTIDNRDFQLSFHYVTWCTLYKDIIYRHEYYKNISIT